jgi:hypothetical protein
MTKITRDVVNDLWPLYESGEASRDTRALVDDFLATDPAFARILRGQTVSLEKEIRVPPDAGAAALIRTRDLIRGNGWLRGMRHIAMVLTILTFGGIISDTTFTRPLRIFITHLIVTVVAWIAYVMTLRWYRQRSLR